MQNLISWDSGQLAWTLTEQTASMASSSPVAFLESAQLASWHQPLQGCMGLYGVNSYLKMVTAPGPWNCIKCPSLVRFLVIENGKGRLRFEFYAVPRSGWVRHCRTGRSVQPADWAPGKRLDGTNSAHSQEQEWREKITEEMRNETEKYEMAVTLLYYHYAVFLRVSNITHSAYSHHLGDHWLASGPLRLRPTRWLGFLRSLASIPGFCPAEEGNIRLRRMGAPGLGLSRCTQRTGIVRTV
ncbi:predicted protein [Histoplasma capsulatum var. duboisii H88]|uniref:Predicted protein n=1 Tax=Ajellomyces capsulatus (strain H88) TaxID=544711 RepID=F0UJH7_AJEC8|nr:predicted protein [Histoplasma capsulatum var. duboisii H88]